MSRNRLGSLLLLAAVILLYGLWKSGYPGLWQYGIGKIADDTATFTDEGGHVLEGTYSLTLDLSDLDSNLGAELYNDGTHRIYVYWLEASGRSPGYEIGFRSSGHYTRSGASLVSGIRHASVDGGRSFTSEMSAVMTVEHPAGSFTAVPTGLGGLNYKDGDDFSFTITLTDDAADREESPMQSGTMTLTVTDLYMNLWRKK